jgi:hypothetical protein
MYELIDHRRLTNSAASIVINNIPQFYTDLYLVTSLRDDVASTGWENAFIYPNGVTTNMGTVFAFGWSTNVGSAQNTPSVIYHQTARGGNEANTFSSSNVYIQNYSSSLFKGIRCETSVERNVAAGINAITSSMWTNTAAITSLQIVAASGNFVAGSSATLYGINRTSLLGKPSQPKAVGGTITYANGYWVHTFSGSGTFVPSVDLTAEYLVIAGGGGTTHGLGSGGGAGGYRSSVVGEFSGGGVPAESPLFLSKNQIYTVTVGAGGAGNQGSNQNFGGQGSDSVFSTITSLGGGRGVGQSINFPNNPPGQAGGSGSGGVRNNNNPGAGTAGQGYAGGTGSNTADAYGGGGGGGAGNVGGNGSGGAAGAGGAGRASSISGTSVTRASGGAGSTNFGPARSATTGGGGAGSSDATGVSATPGETNTGGGGGGGSSAYGLGQNGGSGIVIVRYKAD